jgi:hypothetical protein
MRACLLLFPLFLMPVFALAAGPGCPARDEEGLWSADCFTLQAGVRQLKPQYLRKLSFKKSGKAVIVLEAFPHEVVALDRRGRVVVPGIRHTGDFDYPSAPRGVARFDANGKCGYFQSSTFQVLVPAEYDQCLSFHDGETASACKDCESYCTEIDCQDSRLVGGRGFDFDAHGVLLRSYALSELASACPHGIEKLLREGRRRYLKCKDDPNSPFKLLR